jgi:hopanoid-associated phosphorylase
VALAAVTGLEAEARIARRAGLDAESAGAGLGAATRAAEALVARGATALLSFGIAGGLDPALRTGSPVVATAVATEGGERLAADPVLAAQFASLLPAATTGIILGADRPIATAADKAHLHVATGARAVDTESHLVALAAARHGLPFAALRVVADTAAHGLPPAATAGFVPAGRSPLRPVLVELARSPAQLPALLTLALRTARAFRELGRCAPALRVVKYAP